MLKTNLFLLGALPIVNLLSATEAQSSLDTRVTRIEEQLAKKNQVKPTISASNDFFAEGSYIFWRAYEEGLTYAFLTADKGNPGDRQPSDPFINGPQTFQNLKFDWDSGFRVGIGYRMPYDAWELGVRWTRLHSHAHGPKLTQTTFDEPFLQSTWITNTTFITDSPFTVKAALKLHLDVLDGGISRFFYATPRFSLKPQLGIRGLWITQHYAVSSTGGGSGSIVADIASSSTKVQSQCQGVGLRVAIDTEWEFYKNWSLYGNIGGSLLSNTFKLKSSSKILDVNDTLFSSVSSKNTLNGTILPTLELALGLAWEYSFNDKAVLSMRGGWEFNDFFHQNKLYSFYNEYDTSYSEDLTYQGMALSARLDF